MFIAGVPHRSRGRLSPDKAILLLIDHQIGPLWELEFAALRRKVVGLATATRMLGVPGIITAVDSEDRGPIIPELIAACPGAPVIERTSVSVWQETQIRRAVEATGRTELIIAGVSTKGCVADSALAASAAGYDVHVALDVSSQVGPSEALPDDLRPWPARVVITDSVRVVREMMHDETHPMAREIYAALDTPTLRADAESGAQAVATADASAPRLTPDARSD